MKKFFVTSLVLFLGVSFIGCGGNKTASYKAGTYTAAAKGMNGDVNVLVTFTDSTIKKIEIGEHNETAGISDTPIKEIPTEIIKTQSLAVDTISGETFTSEDILKAGLCLHYGESGGREGVHKKKKENRKGGRGKNKPDCFYRLGGGEGV